MKKYIVLVILSLFVASCSKTEQVLVVPLKNISVKVGDQIILRPESSLSLSYSSENEQIASVNEQGQVVGRLKGTTFILISDGKTTEKVEVSVLPKSTIFAEPILVASSEEFKEKYASLGGEYTENGYKDFYTQKEYSAYYLNKDTDKAYTLVFFHDTAKKELMIEIPNEKAYSVEAILYWITERYIALGQEGDFFHYLSANKALRISTDYDIARGTTQIKIFNN